MNEDEDQLQSLAKKLINIYNACKWSKTKLYLRKKNCRSKKIRNSSVDDQSDTETLNNRYTSTNLGCHIKTIPHRDKSTDTKPLKNITRHTDQTWLLRCEQNKKPVCCYKPSSEDQYVNVFDFTYGDYRDQDTANNEITEEKMNENTETQKELALCRDNTCTAKPPNNDKPKPPITQKGSVVKKMPQGHPEAAQEKGRGPHVPYQHVICPFGPPTGDLCHCGQPCCQCTPKNAIDCCHYNEQQHHLNSPPAHISPSVGCDCSPSAPIEDICCCCSNDDENAMFPACCVVARGNPAMASSPSEVVRIEMLNEVGPMGHNSILSCNRTCCQCHDHQRAPVRTASRYAQADLHNAHKVYPHNAVNGDLHNAHKVYPNHGVNNYHTQPTTSYHAHSGIFQRTLSRDSGGGFLQTPLQGVCKCPCSSDGKEGLFGAGDLLPGVNNDTKDEIRALLFKLDRTLIEEAECHNKNLISIIEQLGKQSSDIKELQVVVKGVVDSKKAPTCKQIEKKIRAREKAVEKEEAKKRKQEAKEREKKKRSEYMMKANKPASSGAQDDPSNMCCKCEYHQKQKQKTIGCCGLCCSNACGGCFAKCCGGCCVKCCDGCCSPFENMCPCCCALADCCDGCCACKSTPTRRKGCKCR